MNELRQAFAAGLQPPPTLTVSQWADQFRMLSAEASAEPGRWRTDRAPYQGAIMDALCDPTVHTVIVMSSSQVGKSEILLNGVGYAIDLDPGPMLLVQPTLEMAEAFSKDRLAPMLRDSPSLRTKVTGGRTDDTNTIRHKVFPGGQLTLAGSNSAAGLASRPIRYVWADEIDRWELSLKNEGDPLALAAKRTTTFWNRKHCYVSTPTIKGVSRIENEYLGSDQRRCYVPCPHCEEPHVLRWAQVKWDVGDPNTAHLVCPTCGSIITEAERQTMLRATPEWRPAAPFRGIAGFHIWEGYSPWRRLADIVADFLKAKDAPDTLQVFVNTSLGESFEQRAEQSDAAVLLARREAFIAVVPAGACCLTMAVDTQDDRLEALVIGWGPGEESWLIDHRRFDGDPQLDDPWNKLDEFLARGFVHETGAELAISGTCVDTAGHRTQYAYEYCRKRLAQSVWAIIGRGGSDLPIISAPSEKRWGKDPRPVALYTIGVDACKSMIYSRLKLTAPGVGFVHLPMPHATEQGEVRWGVDEEFIEQLRSEKLVTRHKMGVPSRTWIKTRPRNEALDLFVYNIAALRRIRPDLEALRRNLLNQPPQAPPPPPVQRTSNWLGPRHGSWLRGNR